MKTKDIKKLAVLDLRIPDWDMSDLIKRTCPFCNLENNELYFLRPDGLEVTKCFQCGAYYLPNIPSEIQLSIFYSKYNESHTQINYKYGLNDYINSFKFLKDKYYRYNVLSGIINISNSEVLDVGCGMCSFGYCLKKFGAIVDGIDIDPKAIEMAKIVGYRTAECQTIENYNSNVKYDLIVLNDILEHVINPKELISKAFSFLKEDGKILIWTPNGGEIDKGFDTALRVDLEHLQYLSCDVIDYLCKNHGYKIRHIECVDYPALSHLVGQKKKSFIKQSLRKLPWFYYLLQKFFAINKENRRTSERLGSYHLFCIIEKSMS